MLSLKNHSADTAKLRMLILEHGSAFSCGEQMADLTSCIKDLNRSSSGSASVQSTRWRVSWLD